MIKNNYKGKFIVIEGLDGSGQSSQVSLVRDFLIGRGLEAVSTKEPTKDSPAGKEIKEILEKKIKIDPIGLQKLFAEDRGWHLENIIIPALESGKFVISDRYFFSSFAYGAADGADLSEVIKINDNFILPDLTFILNTTPKTCIQRIEKRGDPKTLFEREEQLAKVWEFYKKFPEMFENVNVINGEKTIVEVFEEIKNIISVKLK
jgi:dTMP kinase